MPQRPEVKQEMILKKVARAFLSMTHVNLTDALQICICSCFGPFLCSHIYARCGSWQQESSPGKLSTKRSLGSENRSGQLELKPGLPQASPQPSSSLQMTLRPTPYSLAMTTADAASRARGFRQTRRCQSVQVCCLHEVLCVR